MKGEHFDLESATGPVKLDLGNTLYAPLAWYDEKVGSRGIREERCKWLLLCWPGAFDQQLLA
jgi:hypothetical protein